MIIIHCIYFMLNLDEFISSQQIYSSLIQISWRMKINTKKSKEVGIPLVLFFMSGLNVFLIFFRLSFHNCLSCILHYYHNHLNTYSCSLTVEPGQAYPPRLY